MRKSLIAAVLVFAAALVFGGVAQADWRIQEPNAALVFPYVNSLSGFQTFIMVSQQNDNFDFNDNSGSETPNVRVKFNPKCGRGESRSFTLTTKQSLVVTPGTEVEGWAEAFVIDDIDDAHAGSGDTPLSGISGILDIANGVAYTIKALHFEDDVFRSGAGEPTIYGCEDDEGGYDCNESRWGAEADSALVIDLWRHPDNGRTMIVLLDPNGRHINATNATDVVPAFLSNSAQVDIYSKSETDAHKTFEWCTGDDAGQPGIITIGVGTTDGPLGTTDDSITTPAATISDAPYGWGHAYNLRRVVFVDFNGDGDVDGSAIDIDTLEDVGDINNCGQECDSINDLLGARLTRLSNADFPQAVDSGQLYCREEEDDCDNIADFLEN